MEGTKKVQAKRTTVVSKYLPERNIPVTPPYLLPVGQADHGFTPGSQEQEQEAQVGPLHVVTKNQGAPWGLLPVLSVAAPTDGAQVEPLLISHIRPVCGKRQNGNIMRVAQLGIISRVGNLFPAN